MTKKKHPLNSTAWVDHAVVSLATACNLCDAYVHNQVKHEWDHEEKDAQLSSQSSFEHLQATNILVEEDLERQWQIQVYRQVLFDESSLRLEDGWEDGNGVCSSSEEEKDGHDRPAGVEATTRL